jgi:hypothetical protein
VDRDPRCKFLIGLGGRNLLESLDGKPYVLAFCLDIEPDLRKALEFVQVGGKVLSGNGECGFDLEFLDLLDVCEEIDYEFFIERYGQFLRTGKIGRSSSGRTHPENIGKNWPVGEIFRTE